MFNPFGGGSGITKSKLVQSCFAFPTLVDLLGLPCIRARPEASPLVRCSTKTNASCESDRNWRAKEEKRRNRGVVEILRYRQWQAGC